MMCFLYLNICGCSVRKLEAPVFQTARDGSAASPCSPAALCVAVAGPASRWLDHGRLTPSWWPLLWLFCLKHPPPFPPPNTHPYSNPLSPLSTWLKRHFLNQAFADPNSPRLKLHPQTLPRTPGSLTLHGFSSSAKRLLFPTASVTY